MADPYNGYAEYCTGNASYAFQRLRDVQRQRAVSRLVRDRRHQPVVTAVVRADRRPGRLPGHRSGNINPLLYTWFQHRPRCVLQRHHRHGRLQQAATNNGLFPTTPGYDEATGIGTPKFAAIITGF